VRPTRCSATPTGTGARRTRGIERPGTDGTDDAVEREFVDGFLLAGQALPEERCDLMVKASAGYRELAALLHRQETLFAGRRRTGAGRDRRPSPDGRPTA
jgi:hypothetical protein